MWVVAKGEPLYLLVFYASLVARLMLTTFTQFYLLWITSQAARPGETPRDGQMSREDALSLYTNATLTGMVLTLILMPLAGFMSDKVGFEWQLGLSFGIRMSAIIGFLFLKDANNGLAYLISVIVLVFTNLENVFVYALFAKKLPGDIRASMQGLLASVCQLGALMFSQTSIYIIDKYGIKAPFYLVASLDFLMIICVVISDCYGLFDEENEKRKAITKKDIDATRIKEMGSHRIKKKPAIKVNGNKVNVVA